MKAIIAAAVVASLSMIPGAPVEAKVGDRAWSQCVWSQAPSSAEAWLSMPVPSWRSAYTEANVLLGHRLISLCDAAVANPMRPNRMPNWKNIASALRQGKPKTQAPAPQSGSAEVLLCQSALRKDGRSFTHLYEIVRRQAGSETTSFQQYYTEAEGQALKLPQDLRTVPQNASEVVRTCKVIGPRGELTDA